MELCIEFVDESGRSLVLDRWPNGDEESPDKDPDNPGKLRYTHGYLTRMGCSLTRSDSVKKMKDIVTKVTPYFRPGLAAGRQFNRVLFGGAELADTDELTQEVTVNKTEGTLKHASASTLVAEMVVEITVTLLDGREVSLIFDEFPEESIRVRDVTEVIADGTGVELNQLYMVRTYPTLRPVMFEHSQLLLGFHGTRSKGIWAERPYPGPIRPASIPTPPAMKFKIVKEEVFQFLKREEEWWASLEIQQQWQGHIERHAGAQAAITFVLGTPQPTQFYRVINPNGKEHVVHSRRIVPLKIGGVNVCSPDPSFLRGMCRFRPGVQKEKMTEPMYGTELYLPGPGLIKGEGVEYKGYEKGISFGEATVTTEALDNVAASYKLQVTTSEVKLSVVAEVPSPAHGPGSMVVEHIWDGQLQRAITGVIVFSGKAWSYLRETNSPRAEDYSGPKRSFFVYQLTLGGTVPDVMDSAVGRRHAGLVDRSSMVLRHNASSQAAELVTESTGTAAQPALEFFASLPSEPRIVFVHLFVGVGESVTEGYPVVVLWCAGGSMFGLTELDMEHLQSSSIILEADSFAEVNRAVASSPKLHGDIALFVGDPTPNRKQGPSFVTRDPSPRMQPKFQGPGTTDSENSPSVPPSAAHGRSDGMAAGLPTAPASTDVATGAPPTKSELKAAARLAKAEQKAQLKAAKKKDKKKR